MKARCWSCDKSVQVPKDNNNIYTRICKACSKRIEGGK